MTPWTTLATRSTVLPHADIDTDRILPARYMKGLSRQGLGRHLFGDARTHDPRFAIHPDVQLLVTGRNFGSGSSREHAVWALIDHGVRCVVAPSFGSIFAGNAVSNGLLLVALGDADHAVLVTAIGMRPDEAVRVDLEAQTITLGELVLAFAIDPGARAALLSGQDDINRTLRHEPAIAAFEQSRAFT